MEFVFAVHDPWSSFLLMPATSGLLLSRAWPSYLLMVGVELVDGSRALSVIEMTLSHRWAPFLKLAISGSGLLDLLLCPLLLRGVPLLTSLNVWLFGERFC